MDYKGIAKTVHALVKNSDAKLLQQKQVLFKQNNTNEMTIIQNVFSKSEVSGDVLGQGVIPEGLWA